MMFRPFLHPYPNAYPNADTRSSVCALREPGDRAMSEAWSQGSPDESHRTPLQGGEHQGLEEDRGERESRHILLGVSHSSNDPARHRSFEVRAVFDAMTRGWVARVAEQNRNEQPAVWGADLTGSERIPTFPTAAACLGNAVTMIVAMVDREADDQSGVTSPGVIA
jgi:hypothetical protein